MTLPPLDVQMLSTLEMLHYCRRFENSLFAFFFKDSEQCSAVLMDLRVLMAARIQQVIFCEADAALHHTLDSWNRSGDRFSVIEVSAQELKSRELHDRIGSEMVAGNAPFIAIGDMPPRTQDRQLIEADVVACAVNVGAEKFFFPGNAPGLTVNGKCRSYPSVKEVHEILASGATINIPSERLKFLLEQQEMHGLDLVLVEARRGAIFQEVFTHAGSGTLFTRDYPNIFRKAHERDVRDIMSLMQPYIAEGTLKPIREEDLLSMISSFMVYSVNEQIIAAAALIDFGDACELAKLCTLPRFQARGRARALVRALLDEAKAQGKQSVFALTVQPYVAEFFERIGFQEVSREELPEAWKQGYDFSRPSRGYRFVLDTAAQ
jgi:N-acetylglutamate synthase-like GNAT family acetyltransferase